MKKKLPKPFMLMSAVFSLTFLSSCSDTPQQYASTGQLSAPDRLSDKGSRPNSQPSNKDGGLLVYEKKELSEREKDIRTRENSLSPIDYKTGSAGNISLKTDREEALDILNLDYDSGAYSFYKEGLAILWREDPPRRPIFIYIFQGYQGELDFGSLNGERIAGKTGQSFKNYFELEEPDIQKDEKARSFIVSLHKRFEATEESCLTEKKCRLFVSPDARHIVFQFPKMILFFGNDERRALIQIILMNNDNPGCFGKPYDLLKKEFYCGKSDEGRDVFLHLGDDYKTAVKKSGISPQMPIIYDNSLFIQLTGSTLIGWERKTFDEEPERIPEDSKLAYLIMDSQYEQPFLINGSLIKIELKEGGHKISLEPPPESGKPRSAEDMARFAENLDQNSFLLSTNMPQIKDNYRLQKSLIEDILNLAEESYKSLYPDLENDKIYKRIYGKYDDKNALSASGLLIAAPLDKPPWGLAVQIDGASGNANVSSYFVFNDFWKYTIKSQKDIDFSQEALSLSGFTLGENIYLRDKDIGNASAIALYITPEGEALRALASYENEIETAVSHQTGQTAKISWRKSEGLSAGGVSFSLRPTFQTKEMEGKSYDEYEIESLSANGHSFFEGLRGLCLIEGLDFKMGTDDQSFIQSLSQKVAEARLLQEDFAGCPYISPQDILFSGLKRAYFFPKHKMALSFADRELFSFRIYKKESAGN